MKNERTFFDFILTYFNYRAYIELFNIYLLGDQKFSEFLEVLFRNCIPTYYKSSQYKLPLQLELVPRRKSGKSGKDKAVFLFDMAQRVE